MNEIEKESQLVSFGLAYPLPLSLFDKNGDPISAAEFSNWPKSAFKGCQKAIVEYIQTHEPDLSDKDLALLRRYTRIEHHSELLENFEMHAQRWEQATHCINNLANTRQNGLDPRPYLDLKDHALLLALGPKEDASYQVAFAKSRLYRVLQALSENDLSSKSFKKSDFKDSVQSYLESIADDNPTGSSRSIQLNRLISCVENNKSHLCGPFHIKSFEDNKKNLRFHLYVNQNGSELPLGKPFTMSPARLSGLFDKLMYYMRFTSINAIASQMKKTSSSGNHLRKAKTVYYLDLGGSKETCLNLSQYMHAPEAGLVLQSDSAFDLLNVPYSAALGKSASFFKQCDMGHEMLMEHFYAENQDAFLPCSAQEMVFSDPLASYYMDSYMLPEVRFLASLADHEQAFNILSLIVPAKAFGKDEVAKERELVQSIDPSLHPGYSKNDLLHTALLFRAARNGVGYKLHPKCDEKSLLPMQSQKIQDMYGFLCANSHIFDISKEVESVIKDNQAKVASSFTSKTAFELEDELKDCSDEDFEFHGL